MTARAYAPEPSFRTLPALRSALPASRPDGRRARKTVSVWQDNAWQPAYSSQYLYDRWNLIQEHTQTPTPPYSHTLSYTWGLDLSGFEDGTWSQDSGGIGGLLAVTEVSGTSTNIFLPVCDQVGTVHALVAAVTNNVALAAPFVAVRYEYSPYGELLEADVSPHLSAPCSLLPAPCFFGFQSKLRDAETGFWYFGHRFFDSRCAQWLTHDPLREEGGFNLSAFCGGDPVGKVDPWGLAIYAFDGTWKDKEDRRHRVTNVAILHDLYDATKRRSYIRGVGTGSKVDKYVGGITGSGGEWRLENMWDELVKNFENGDKEIVIVGFSRGAALAREFANMIAERGDPTKYRPAAYGSLVVTPYAGTYGCPLVSQVVPEHVEGDAPRIQFMGLFDTVASFGVPGNDINIGYRMGIPKNVDKADQAVAISEHRGNFPLSSVVPRGTHFDFPSGIGSDPTGRLVERKFLGAHADIGGGYKENLASLEPLRWIVEQAQAAGITMGPIDIDRYFNTAAGVVYHDSDVPFGNPHPFGTRPLPGGAARSVFHYE